MGLELNHWGSHVAFALQARGVDTLFTLSGGQIFPIFDGAVQAGIRIVDFRHEASAAFAAEAWGRLKRRAGVVAVTAGPGVFNTTSVVATAQKSGTPLLVLGGRAPKERWGKGSLQEVDHPPVLAPLAKRSETIETEVLRRVSAGIREAMTPPRGAVFFDFPVDLVAEGKESDVDSTAPARIEPDPGVIRKIIGRVAEARRPILIAGTNVYQDGAGESVRAFAERARVPVFANGMGRGTLPADHELSFSRSRSRAMRESDVVIVAGTPLDFRLGFGDGFAADAAVIHLESAASMISTNRPLAAALGADLELAFRALAQDARPSTSAEWIKSLRADERRREADAAKDLASTQVPIHPLRVYGELKKLLARDAVIVCDGGDFVSYAGREIPSSVPGTWLDPGPFGCLGCGPGYAIAAKLIYPNRQVVLILGDGAFGFSGMEFDTMVRHKLPVVAVVGNNGVWGLEKSMKGLFGYDVAADLRQETRYDEVVKALGGHGELVTKPDELEPALRRAFDAGVPALVNVHIDPQIMYPRSANLV
jgi:acetolactate synthase I/II/III large subunit